MDNSNNDKINNEIAAKIIEDGTYMTIGTMNDEKPWVSPTVYWLDDSSKNISFYFVSDIASLHVKNISNNKLAAISIFNSTLPEGFGDKAGLQISTSAEILTFDQKNGELFENKEIEKAISLIQQRYSFAKNDTIKSRCIQWYKNGRVIVKLTPIDNEIYLNVFDGKVDKRVLVKIDRRLKIRIFGDDM
jgi:uncharacterized protein YhbP (UPF0306 family)